ncbi:MAG: GNAT family N-acetyltransferase [Roseiflexaceae bacterium]
MERATEPTPQHAPFFVIRPARMDDIYPILRLHREAFHDKFGAAFGARGAERGIEAMAEAWRRQGLSALRGMLVAVADGRVIGTTSLRTWEMGSDASGAAEVAFHRVLGTWGALRSIFTLSLLDHHIDRNEGYITDVAVLYEFRRQGVARALLQRAEEEARLRNKRFVGLYVSARNAGARHLYEDVGFVVLRSRSSLLAALLLRQYRWLYMRKDL